MQVVVAHMVGYGIRISGVKAPYKGFRDHGVVISAELLGHWMGYKELVLGLVQLLVAVRSM